MELAAGYRIPMDFDRFFGKKQFTQCSIQESIASYIHLLIITCEEEFDFDRHFGCEVWEYEFEHQQSTRIWADQLSKNLKNTLETYEQRIKSIEVKTEVSQAEFEQVQESSVAKRLKKKLNVRVTARLTSTDETFSFEDNILLSPFSTD